MDVVYFDSFILMNDVGVVLVSFQIRIQDTFMFLFTFSILSTKELNFKRRRSTMDEWRNLNEFEWMVYKSMQNCNMFEIILGKRKF